MRYSIFQQLGEGTIYQYAQPEDRLDYSITDSVYYDKMEPIITFSNPEPRFSARYLLNSTSSLKFSYNRMVQNIHLMSNSTVPIPFNTWAPSSSRKKPISGPWDISEIYGTTASTSNLPTQDLPTS